MESRASIGRWISIVFLLALATGRGPVAGAPPALPELRAVVVATGMSQPLAFVQDPTDPRVQFILEQAGRVRILRDGVLLADDFLNVAGQITASDERGLLGFAFAPDYGVSRRFFVNMIDLSGNTVIARYVRSATDPLRADAASRFDFRWPDGNRFIVQPFSNHNGGDLHFGSDGYLYAALGDGGSGNDPFHHAQNPATLLGKMLRLDVGVPDSDAEGYDVPPDNPFVGRSGYLPEIWAFGLRNPFRFTVDAIERGGNGALLIGDVGQSTWEEIDYQPAGAGGRNYGWRNREGAHTNVDSLPPAYLPLIDPIIEYQNPNDAFSTAVISGPVNRGTSLGVPFFGRYFHADFGHGQLWSSRLVVNPTTREATVIDLTEHTAEITASLGGDFPFISAFGLDASCRIYVLDWVRGRLLRIELANDTLPAMCATPDPFLALGGGVFVNGGWLPPDHPGASTGTSTGTPPPSPSTCATAMPAPGWVCVNGGWVPPDHPLASSGGSNGGGTTPGSPPPDGGGSSTPAACTTPLPAAGWVCVNGGWVPPDHPLAASGGSPPSGGTSGGTTGGSTGGSTACTTPRPGADWVCVNGGWVPPDHPAARRGRD